MTPGGKWAIVRVPLIRFMFACKYSHILSLENSFSFARLSIRCIISKTHNLNRKKNIMNAIEMCTSASDWKMAKKMNSEIVWAKDITVERKPREETVG
jgi:hypothetical protein